MDSKTVNYGGKANSLITLRNASLPVPEFFIISLDIYDEFLKENNILEDINKYLKDNQYDKVQELIINSSFSNKLKQKIYDEFKKLDSEEVAVRSSAINEDGVVKSFAGQYQSFLNVKEDDLLESIKKCWSSLYDENVIEYNNSENIDIFGMNVIVQKMINPYCAGVAFSLNPVSKSKSYSYIEACLGDGEKLVSGSVTPSTYTVRRETKRVDAHTGEDLLDNKVIENLEDYVLKIEDEFHKPVDIEWCFSDGKLYILQARPITSFNIANDQIKNMITRDKKLWQIELYFNGEYHGIKDLTNGLYCQNPIFNFISPQKTEIYYNDSALEERPALVFRGLDDNYEYFSLKIDKAKIVCEEILNLIKEKDLDFPSIVDRYNYIQPFNTLGNIAGRDWEISDRVKTKLFDYREKYDYVIYKCEEAVSEYLERIIPNELKQYMSVLSIDDIKNIENVDIKVLENRLNGFIYYQGQFLENDFDKFCKDNYLMIKEEVVDDPSIIKGTSAYSGSIKGKVKIIYSKEDFCKFNEGDIIVAPMTTPKYMSIMKIAGGIITDEGGVTCHASIVARELKKPCLVGCKNATKRLKDDMEVLLDATNNQVKIL